MIKSNLSPATLMFLATFFFSLMELMVKALPRIPTAQVVFFRAIIAFIICYVLLKRKKISVWGVNKKWLFLRGLSGTIALIFFFYSIKTLPLATAATLQKLSPIFTIFFAQFVMKESFAPIQWLVFFFSFIGVFFLRGFDSETQLETLPILLAISAAILSGFAYNAVAKVRSTDDPLVVIFYFPLVTLPIITPYTIKHWVQPNLTEWFILIAIGVVVQFAQYAMTLSLQRSQTMSVSIIYYFGVLLASFYGFLFFAESFDITKIIGILIILFSVVTMIKLKPSPEKKYAIISK